ncbi:FAD:protein FMN transferase [Psychromonas ossibalaenae]|uniref:FAD:protein FMN transferase n=1 Tax=Psychromonas ossibalaenae TaxID=444922 RepID=UPI0003817BC7|nr:FAD:protein FMN transferase [Psychromonas ossibalaenae]
MLPGLTLKKEKNGKAFSAHFQAMACDCEVLLECRGRALAVKLSEAVFKEAKRIETKFSRYLKNNIVYQINNSTGEAVNVDDESAHLLDFAYMCYQFSDGLFDISSGILRRVWTFDGSDNVPEQRQINKLLPFIGLDKVSWQPPLLKLPAEMELDFGGFGKEYAVDCCLAKALQVCAEVPVLLNFGGDLICNGPRENQQPWKVGIESVGGGASALVTLSGGALATSGDANRYLMKEGRRYSHILNPLTGSSVSDAPRSVTVAAESCIEAGLLSTMAMLQGPEAEDFLAAQEVNFWIQD